MKLQDCLPPPLCLNNGGTDPPAARPGDRDRQEHSGFVVIRLARDVIATEGDDLASIAGEYKLSGLLRILDQWEIQSTRRIVRALKPEEVLRLERRAAQTDFPPLRSLTSYWRLDLRHRPGNLEEVVARLNELHEVDLAYAERAVSDPVVNAANDTYAASQGYLDAAPTGIDARWAWTQPNGEGAGVGVVDLEQGWFLSHEDLAGKAPTLIYGDNRDGVGTYKGNHGTAVLGEIGADDNTLGVVGIAPSVASLRVTSHYDAATNTALHVADAIIAAIPTMNLGDVLLLEVQRGFDPLPTETDDADFDAIRLAVALGIIVVEAAGNGNNDLDAYTDGAGDTVLARGTADFRDSGAIMVGAAESDDTHDRASFSNYGSRVDCYAWGENVVTCGYGDLDDGAGNDNRTYTDTFGGTSSASPIIVGAASIVQGMYESATSTRLSPPQMRTLLSNPATGTAQGPNVAGNIGVMPDLHAIINATLGLVPDIYIRDNTADTGAVPATGAISASPDVILRPVAVADPTASFGQGSGTENSTALGFQAEAGQDNFIYVRMKNRGTSDAVNAIARVYWSEVSTLVTPDLWNLIGDSPSLTVPQGDTLVVADALTWPAADIPATGHYCFVALLDHAQDAAPPLPPGPPTFDWNAFLDFIRAHNNVTWRNFNVVDALPDPSGDPSALPFLIAGAPDRARAFDFEIIRRLPARAQLILEMPLALAGQIAERRMWKVEVDRKRGVARAVLPALPRLGVCGLKLPAAARHRCRFLVRGGKRVDFRGTGVAIRQVFEGLEVGRVTWEYASAKRNPRR